MTTLDLSGERRRGPPSRRIDDGISPATAQNWIRTILTVGAVVVSIVLAYAALDKRIALIEQALSEQRQKLDLIIYQQSGKR